MVESVYQISTLNKSHNESLLVTTINSLGQTIAVSAVVWPHDIRQTLLKFIIDKYGASKDAQKKECHGEKNKLLKLAQWPPEISGRASSVKDSVV